MIRNVVLGRLRDPRDAAELERAVAGIGALTLPGQLAMHAGFDLGLRPGGWTFAITNDWLNEQAYRSYDGDAEHNVHRAVIVALCDEVARVQFAVLD